MSDMVKRLTDIKVGVCMYCKLNVTEADSWGHWGSMEGYMEGKVAKAYHTQCQSDNAFKDPVTP